MRPGSAVAIKAAAGTVVTIGDFRAAGASPARTTWGDPVRYSPDAGVPLRLYSARDYDPLHIWKTQPAVRRVVGFKARNIASVPWHAYQRVSDNKRTRQAESRAEVLLNQPARFRSGFNTMETLVIDKCLYDRWCLMFWAGEPGNPRKPDRLVRIPPKLLDIRTNFLGEVDQVMLINPQPGEPDVDLTDAPIALSYGWSGAGGGGISPMATLAAILRENNRAVEWRTSVWENGPKISGILKHPGGFKDDTKRTRFVQDWKTWKENSGAGGTPILENGMEYEQLDSFSPRDARDIEGRTLTDMEVSTQFFVPPELLGIRPGNFSNMQAFRTMLHGTVLGPDYSDFHQAINAGLVEHLDARKGIYVEQARNKIIEGSPLEQARLWQVLVGGPVVTPNEARAEMNREPLDGGDELLVPLNVSEGGQANPQDSGDQNRTGDNPDEGDTQQ